MADNLAQGLTNNDLPWLKSMLPRMAAVTAADIQRVAKKYLDPQKRVVVWSVPKPGKEQGGGAAAATARQSLVASALPGGAWERGPRGGKALRLDRRDSPPSAGGASEFSLKDTKRFVLPNGLVLLLWVNHRLPIVVASARPSSSSSEYSVVSSATQSAAASPIPSS